MTVPYPQPAPPEWAPQSSLWVGWPRLPGEWGEAFAAARAEIAAFVRAVSPYVRVRLAVGDDEAAAAARACLGAGTVAIERIPTGDIWLRDTGPVFTGFQAGGQVAHCFRFNGWGGKFDMPGDRDTARAIAAAQAGELQVHDVVLEGGALEHDGAGTVITTRQCLLNPNRNPGWSEVDYERLFEAVLGARRVIWLERGLVNDHTDGHVDNLARFHGEGRVLCQSPAGPDDPNGDRLGEIENTLRAAGLEVTLLPSPGRVHGEDGAVLAASHMNFVITNGTVICPAYGDEPDRRVDDALARAYRGAHVQRLGSRAILSGGGSFHCMTCHVPAPGEGDIFR